MNETDVAFEVLGVGAVVAVAGAPAERIREGLPPGARERSALPEDARFRIEGDAPAAVERLRGELLEHVAVHAPDHLVVRGGAVAMGERAIVVLGERASALVPALVQEGATAYADGYVPIDTDGSVHSFPPGQAPVPVAVVAALQPDASAGPALDEVSADDGIMLLLHHACGSERRPEFALRAARAAARDALVLGGGLGDPRPVAAALIERLAQIPLGGPRERTELARVVRDALTPAMQFASLVVELEGEIVELARTLEGAGVDAVLLNGDEVRPALAHGFSFSFAAVIEIPLGQVPRALGAMESERWQRVRPDGAARYFRRGVVVAIRPRAPGPRRRAAHEALAKGRFGFAEPEANVAGGEPKGALGPMPAELGGSRAGRLGKALQRTAETLAAVDTLRLRARERSFHGRAIQYGPGVHAFESSTEALVDAVLARLPDDAADVRFVDVGTGTGAVALTVGAELPRAEVLGTDVSLRALGWARRNRRRLGLRNVRFARGSLLAPVPPAWRGRVTAIAANAPMALPASGVELRGLLGWPMGTATGPGADGLGLVRALSRDARDMLAPGGHLHLRLLYQQGAWIAPYLAELGYEAEIPDSDDAYTIEVVARRPGPGRG